MTAMTTRERSCRLRCLGQRRLCRKPAGLGDLQTALHNIYFPRGEEPTAEIPCLLTPTSTGLRLSFDGEPSIWQPLFSLALWAAIRYVERESDEVDGQGNKGVTLGGFVPLDHVALPLPLIKPYFLRTGQENVTGNNITHPPLFVVVMRPRGTRDTLSCFMFVGASSWQVVWLTRQLQRALAAQTPPSRVTTNPEIKEILQESAASLRPQLLHLPKSFSYPLISGKRCIGNANIYAELSLTLTQSDSALASPLSACDNETQPYKLTSQKHVSLHQWQENKPSGTTILQRGEFTLLPRTQEWTQVANDSKPNFSRAIVGAWFARKLSNAASMPSATMASESEDDSANEADTESLADVEGENHAAISQGLLITRIINSEDRTDLEDDEDRTWFGHDPHSKDVAKLKKEAEIGAVFQELTSNKISDFVGV